MYPLMLHHPALRWLALAALAFALSLPAMLPNTAMYAL
jgi:hypothetical protein